MKTKIIGERVTPNQPGAVKIIPEDSEDLWLAYNLIARGDTVTSVTTRKIQADYGGRKPIRVRLNLEITITNVEYTRDPSSLRVRGKSVMATPEVPAGSFHTLDLEINKEFELKKKRWDKVMVDRLQEGCERAIGADLAVLLLQQGFVELYLVGNRVNKLCARIEAQTGKKAGGNKLFESIFNAFVKHVDFDTVKCVVIGSPDATKDEFYQYLLLEAQKKKLKAIENNKSRIVKVSTTAGNENNLSEILGDNALMNRIKDTKTGLEIRAFKRFSDGLLRNSESICYGTKDVETAQERMAIETLLISDDLVRSAEIETRKKYMGLVDSVKRAGGKAYEYSSKHGLGEELAKFTGIAAILRFPIHDFDDDDDT